MPASRKGRHRAPRRCSNASATGCARAWPAARPGGSRPTFPHRRLWHAGQGVWRQRAHSDMQRRPCAARSCVRARRRASELTLVDARPADEYAFLSVPGAANHAGTELALRQWSTDPSGAPWVINCFSRTRGIIGNDHAASARPSRRALSRRRRDAMGAGRRTGHPERAARATMLPVAPDAELSRRADGSHRAPPASAASRGRNSSACAPNPIAPSTSSTCVPKLPPRAPDGVRAVAGWAVADALREPGRHAQCPHRAARRAAPPARSDHGLLAAATRSGRSLHPRRSLAADGPPNHRGPSVDYTGA